ncbi:CpsD/CapB family tyrosine-protein kinase [Alicyclobacillus curvatus]|nr:CpsD/CapB family tyrosine-protein kinase [Alicyclobacillus curvatus]
MTLTQESADFCRIPWSLSLLFKGVCRELSLSSKKPVPIAQSDPRSPITEAYRTIRTNLQFASAVDDIKVVLLTSALPSEGKTSTVSNTAVVTAEAGKKVLLIDADMRKPQIHQRFQISNLRGLSTVLIREGALGDCIVPSDTEGLFLLPSGPIPPNPSELLASKRFAELIQECREQFDLIFIDSPPVLSVSDALILTRSSDGVVFVLDAQATNRKLAQKAVASLQQIQAKLLGVVLNRVKNEPGNSYYYYHYYSSGNSASV